MPDHSILAYISEQLSLIPSPVKRWVIAYSGGIDSTVLLHSVIDVNRRLPTPLPITALHIHHQLSPNADYWQQQCATVAQTLGVEFVTQRVAVKLQGSGIEAAARDARYTVFEQYLQTGDVLLFGHHQQDQSETLLLRLFRGAGVRGLQAMPVSRALGDGELWRPLLAATKAEIASYAQHHQLQWIDDESNTDDGYDRNFLRHRILPLLRSRWSALDEQLVKTTARMGEANQLLNEVAEADLALLDSQVARLGFSIDFNAIRLLSAARKNNTLRYWCESVGYPVPTADALFEIDKQLFSRSALLSSACVSWGNHSLRQFAGRLYLLPALPFFAPDGTANIWDVNNGADVIKLGAAGALKLVAENEGGLRLAHKNYHIRWRQGGERCTPTHRQHSQTLKKLLQEYGLETWLRDRVPLLYSGDDLVAVGDLWVNTAYEPSPEEAVMHIRWDCA